MNVTTVDVLENEFDVLRLKWKETLVGTKDFKSTNRNIIKSIEEITQKAEIFWTTMNKGEHRNFLWSDLASIEISGHITDCYARLKQMTLAYSLKGSALENNKELLKDLIQALDWMYENRYNENANYYDNWWPWDIGVPLRLNDIVVLIYEELSQKQIENYMKSIHRFIPEPTTCRSDKVKSTGANRVDLCKAVAISGILSKKSEKLSIAKNSLSDVFQYVTEKDGFYKDGSFVQHGAIPYTCSYGAVLLEGISVILTLLSNSPWEVTDPAVNNVYQWICDSYEPLLYKGAGMDMVRGRGISRYFMQDHVIGHDIISSILRISTFAPEPYGSNFKRMVKAWLEEDWSRSFYEDMDIPFAILAEKLMKEESVESKKELLGHWNFANMDRVVHRGPGYAFGISMYSKRIQNYEDMNDENKKGWYTSDGMTYLYNGDLSQYSNDFWPTVNPYRICGTTVDPMEREVVLQKVGRGGQRKSSKSWVGGTSIDNLYGVAGMELESGFSSLEARKSWFMFQKEIVALGTGIKSIDGRNIETIIENRRVDNLTEAEFLVEGKSTAKRSQWQEEFNGATWMHLKGTKEGSDIGYYFPCATVIKALKEKRKGTWKEINMDGTEDIIEREYLTLWTEHGINPTSEGYAYVLLPNQNKEAVKKYAENPEIQILENRKEVQAVKNNRVNVIAANFWEDKEETVEYITCNKKASLMILEKKETLELSISDPTMENEETIELQLSKNVKEVLCTDEEIEVQQISPVIKLVVKVKNSRGKTMKVKFSLA